MNLTDKKCVHVFKVSFLFMEVVGKNIEASKINFGHE